MSTPVLYQLEAELHKRELYRDGECERLARLASQQRTGSSVLDDVLSGLGDWLIALGRQLKQQHFVEPTPRWRVSSNAQTETRIIKI